MSSYGNRFVSSRVITNPPTTTNYTTTAYRPLGNPQSNAPIVRQQTRLYGQTRQQTPPSTPSIPSKNEIYTPPQIEKTGENEIYGQLDKFASAFSECISQDIILKALNNISSSKTSKFKEAFKRIIQMFCIYKQNYFKQQNDLKLYENNILEILKSQQLCDPLNYGKFPVLKDVARLWNDRKIIEDYASKGKIESKAYLSSYITKTGFDILDKLEKKEQSNSKPGITSLNKTSSTVYIQRDIAEELENVLNGSFSRTNSKFKYYAPKMSEAIEKFSRDLNDKLSSLRREVRPSTARNEDAENLKQSIMRQADLRQKMLRKIVDILRETPPIDEQDLRKRYEKFSLSPLFDEVVKVHDEKYKKLQQSKNTPVKTQAYEFMTKTPIKIGNLRESNAHEKSKSLEGDIAAKEKQLELINNQIQKTEEDYKLSQAKFGKIQRQVNDFESKLQAKQKQSATLAAQTESMTMTKNGLKVDIDKLLTEKAEAQRNRTELDKIVSDLKIQNDKLANQKYLLEGQLKNLETRSKQPILSYQSTTQSANKIKNLEQKSKDLQNKLAAAQYNEREMKLQKERIEGDFNDKQMHIDDLTLKLKDLTGKLQSAANNRGNNDELQRLKDTVSQLNSQMAQKDRQLRKYETEIIPKNQREVTSLKDQLTQYLEVERQYIKQNQRLNSELQQVYEKINKAEEQANLKSKQLNQEEKKRRDTEAENNQNVNKLRQTEKQLIELKKITETEKKQFETRASTVSSVDRMKYTKEIESLKKDLSDRDKQLKQQLTQKETLKIKFSDLEKKSVQSKRDAQTVEAKLLDAVKENNRLQKIIAEKESALQTQSREIEKLNQNCKQSEAFEKEKCQLIDAIRSREAYINDRLADLNKCNADIQILVGIKDTLEKEKNQREQTVNTILENMNKRQLEINFLTSENKNLKDQMTQLKGKISSSEKELKAASDKAKSDAIKSQNQQIKATNREIIELKASRAKWESEKKDLDRKITELNNLNTRNNASVNREETLRKDLEKCRTDLRKIQDQKRQMTMKNDRESQDFRNKLQQIESSNTKKDTEIQKLTNQLKQSEQILAKKDNEIQKMSSQLKQLQSSNKKLNVDLQEAQRKTQSVSRIQDPRDTLKLNQLEAKNKEYERKIKEKDQEIKTMQTDLQQKNNNISDQMVLIETLETKISKMESEASKSKIASPARNLYENPRAAEQLRAALSKSQALTKTNQDLQTDIKRYITDNQLLQDKLSKIEAELRESVIIVQDLSKQESVIEAKLKQSTLQVRVLSNQKANLQGELKLTKEDITRDKKILISRQRQISQKTQQISSLREAFSKIEKEKQRYQPQVMTSTLPTFNKSSSTVNDVNADKKTIERLQKQLEVVKSKIISMASTSINPASEKSICYNCFFYGKVLDRDQDRKRYLLENLSEYIKRKIIRTEIIYSYDPQNKVNFHKYIDTKEQIVLLIKLKNGSLIASYSESGFAPKVPSSKDGLLISLTNQEIFKLAQANRRAITYDDFYLIFGNSEIRIKSQDTALFSNFAISNGYYNAKGKKVDILLGGGPNEREVQMQHYEVFQLILQND